MNDIVLLMLAVSAAVVGWIATQAILKMIRGKRERLQERLSTQRAVKTPTNDRSIVLPKKDDFAAGKAMVVGKFRKHLSQAWPDMTPSRFMAIVVILFMAVFMMSATVTHSLTVGMVGGALAGAIPFMMMQARRTKRAR